MLKLQVLQNGTSRSPPQPSKPCLDAILNHIGCLNATGMQQQLNVQFYGQHGIFSKVETQLYLVSRWNTKHSLYIFIVTCHGKTNKSIVFFILIALAMWKNASPNPNESVGLCRKMRVSRCLHETWKLLGHWTLRACKMLLCKYMYLGYVYTRV